MNPNHHPFHLLLVDDHPLVRTGIRAALQHRFGRLQVTEAGSAAEALHHLANGHPHLILLDVNLPGTNGLDLARQIRREDKHARILMVAADADPWTVDEALRAGASGFVAKTNSSDQLPAAIDAVMAGRIFLCPDSQAALRRSETRADVAAEPPGPAVLSHRECEVLRCLAHGENTKSIAALMGISANTVQTHRQHIMRKLHTDNVAALTRYAIRHGLASPL